jgi:protocatechuate 3,4-dioxygenase alpha subunit
MTPTPGQTVGPFFGFALEYPGDAALVPAGHPDGVVLHGRVLDGAGEPVPDALVELWQADPAGGVPQAEGSLRRDGSTFTGWGRSGTDADGRYSFTTLRPAAPFVSITVFARGLMHRLFTRAYLPGADIAGDPLLASLSPARSATLLACEDAEGLRFDIRLQGLGETVFLRFPGQRD